jgi:FHA domain
MPPHSPSCLDWAEPNDAWTVEQALQYCLIQAHKETEAKYHQIEVSLNQQFEKGKNEIWKCHEKVLEESKKANVQNSPCPTRDITKNGNSGKQSAKAPTTVNVEIIGGHYAGNTYNLTPKVRQPCWVGRSQGKKFKDRGISLSKDLEISTTHGKFELVGGKLHYTDAGSTNGSKVYGEDLPPEKPFPLVNGVELVLGQSILRIHLS